MAELTTLPEAKPTVVAPIDATEITKAEIEARKKAYDAFINAATVPEKIAGLKNVVSKDPFDPVAETAFPTLKKLEQRYGDASKKFGAIEEAGGPNTPGGNMAAAKLWETQKDRPEWGTALIAYLSGNKAAAFNLVTGGQVKDQVSWGKDGGRYISSVNELGQPSRIIDSAGRELSKQDAEDLGI